MKRWIVAGLIMLTTGCAAERLRGQHDAMVAQGQPVPYADGYSHGCNSGTSAAGNPYYYFQKDIGRFQTDSLYAQGWGDGFQVCRSQYESTMRSMQR